jgi:protein SCO1
MSRKTIFYIIFFFLLVIGFYLTMSWLIPGFGKSRLEPIGRVLPFSFINQDGKKVTEKDVAGKIFVAEYFFTTCKSWCPIMHDNMKIVYEKFKNEKDFLIVSHTSDPATDSAARLKKYADSLNVNTEKWIFLTGTKDSLYKQARYSYKIDDPHNNPLNSNEVDFLHSQFFSLVDKKGVVRRIYEGNVRNDVEKMIEQIEVLLKEK